MFLHTDQPHLGLIQQPQYLPFTPVLQQPTIQQLPSYLCMDQQLPQRLPQLLMYHHQQSMELQVNQLVMNILPLLIHFSILPDQLHLMPLLLCQAMLLHISPVMLLFPPILPMLLLHPSLLMLLLPQNRHMLLPSLPTHQPLS